MEIESDFIKWKVIKFLRDKKVICKFVKIKLEKFKKIKFGDEKVF